MRESLKAFILKNKAPKIKAMELGVMAGAHSKIMYDALIPRLQRLYLIDSWKVSYRPEMHDRLLTTVQKFEENPIITVIKQDSLRCLELFNNNSIDFIYIDNAHDYEHVLREIENWYAKVKPGGMLAGHDVNLQHPERVLKAVNNFCYDNNLNFSHKQNEGEQVGDWWIVKL